MQRFDVAGILLEKEHLEGCGFLVTTSAALLEAEELQVDDDLAYFGWAHYGAFLSQSLQKHTLVAQLASVHHSAPR